MEAEATAEPIGVEADGTGPITVVAERKLAIGRLAAGLVGGGGVLAFLSVPIGALLLGATLAGAAYEVVTRRRDKRLLEIRPEGLVVYREFYARHPEGLPIAWEQVVDARCVPGQAPYLAVMLSEEALSTVELSAFDRGQLRVLMMDARPDCREALAHIERLRALAQD
jgi:hypothetical protein